MFKAKIYPLSILLFVYVFYIQSMLLILSKTEQSQRRTFLIPFVS